MEDQVKDIRCQRRIGCRHKAEAAHKEQVQHNVDHCRCQRAIHDVGRLLRVVLRIDHHIVDKQHKGYHDERHRHIRCLLILFATQYPDHLRGNGDHAHAERRKHSAKLKRSVLDVLGIVGIHFLVEPGAPHRCDGIRQHGKHQLYIARQTVDARCRITDH